MKPFSLRRRFHRGIGIAGQLGRAGISETGAQVPRSPGFPDYNSGAPTEVELPADVDPMSVAHIGAAFYNTFVLLAGSGVLCSGSNAAGQCGSAIATHAGLKPIPELDHERLKRVAGGYCHTMALTESGRLYTLGCGEDGQRGDDRPLADEDEFPAATMNEVVLPSGQLVGAIAAGANHSLAISKDGRSLWGWGSNDIGQLGPSVEDNVSTPVPISIDIDRPGDPVTNRIVSVTAGYAHSAVLTTSGRVFTFGRGENGQLGSKTAEDNPTPTEVAMSQGSPLPQCSVGR